MLWLALLVSHFAAYKIGRYSRVTKYAPQFAMQIGMAFTILN